MRPRLVSIADAVAVDAWQPCPTCTAATVVRVLFLPILLRLPPLVPRTGTSPVLACPALLMVVLLLVLSWWLLLVGLLALLLLMLVRLLLLLIPVSTGATFRRATCAARVVARAGTGGTPPST